MYYCEFYITGIVRPNATMDQISATIELSPEEDLKGLNFGTED